MQKPISGRATSSTEKPIFFPPNLTFFISFTHLFYVAYLFTSIKIKIINQINFDFTIS